MVSSSGCCREERAKMRTFGGVSYSKDALYRDDRTSSGQTTSAKSIEHPGWWNVLPVASSKMKIHVHTIGQPCVLRNTREAHWRTPTMCKEKQCPMQDTVFVHFHDSEGGLQSWQLNVVIWPHSKRPASRPPESHGNYYMVFTTVHSPLWWYRRPLLSGLFDVSKFGHNTCMHVCVQPFSYAWLVWGRSLVWSGTLLRLCMHACSRRDTVKMAKKAWWVLLFLLLNYIKICYAYLQLLCEHTKQACAFITRWEWGQVDGWWSRLCSKGRSVGKGTTTCTHMKMYTHEVPPSQPTHKTCKKMCQRQKVGNIMS